MSTHNIPSLFLRTTLLTAVSVQGFVVPSTPAMIRASSSSLALQSAKHAPALAMSTNSQPLHADALSRRSAMIGMAGILGLLVPTGNSQAWADFPPVSQTEDGFVAAANGVKIKDYVAGTGPETKDGDVLRIQFALYLPDGTIVSRFAGMEEKLTLGKTPQPFPAGLAESVRGMKVGGERAIIIPPDLGWTEQFRAIAVTYLRGCSGVCPLDNTPIIAQVKLIGFVKGECAEGDAPVSADLSQLKDGKLLLKIGSEVCPEGPVEVTEQRLKTRSMIDKLKQAGKL